MGSLSCLWFKRKIISPKVCFVMELCEKIGLPVQMSFLTAHDLYVADECFVTGTGAELIPVVDLCGRPIGSGTPGPITKQLLTEFRNLTQSEGTEIFKVASL